MGKKNQNSGKKNESCERDRIIVDVIVISNEHSIFKCSMKDNPDVIVTCTLSGKIRSQNIRIIPGDHCRCELSSYNLSMGRLVYRSKTA